MATRSGRRTRHATEAIARAVAQACRVLHLMGMDDMNLGHVSAREPGGGVLWMKPQGLGFAEVSPADIVAMDLDGRRVAGTLPIHGEWPIHTEIYRARSDVASVVHVHPALATVWSSTGKAVLPYTQAGALFAGGVPLFADTPELIVRPEQGRRLASALGDRPAALMINHGVVAVGRTAAEACITAYLLEEVVAAQMLAERHGGRPMDPAVARRMRTAVYPSQKFDMLWNYWIREANRSLSGNARGGRRTPPRVGM